MSLADVIGRIDAEARRKLERKLPSWAGADIKVPASLNLEQCSSEATALYKAGLIGPGLKVADLTGGLGADSWAFSWMAGAVWYNERDTVLMEVVRRNFGLLGVSNVVFNSFDVVAGSGAWVDSLRGFGPDLIYLDPGRRDSAGRKVFLLEDCSPDVVALMPVLLELAPSVMVKVSPMADLTMLRRRLDGVLGELHVVGVAGECKEVLCLCRRDASFAGVVLAEDGRTLRSDIPFRPQKNGDQYLFVPSAAMVKSGLGPGMCLMGYDGELGHFGRFWQVVENLPFASSVLKSLGSRYPQAEVTARGVPVSSEELRKKLRTKPGGSVHIFACVLNGERRILVCEQVLAPE